MYQIADLRAKVGVLPPDTTGYQCPWSRLSFQCYEHIRSSRQSSTDVPTLVIGMNIEYRTLLVMCLLCVFTVLVVPIPCASDRLMIPCGCYLVNACS